MIVIDRFTTNSTIASNLKIFMRPGAFCRFNHKSDQKSSVPYFEPLASCMPATSSSTVPAVTDFKDFPLELKLCC